MIWRTEHLLHGMFRLPFVFMEPHNEPTHARLEPAPRVLVYYSGDKVTTVPYLWNLFGHSSRRRLSSLS